MQSLDSGDVVSTNFLVLNLIEKKLNSEAMNKSLSGKKKKKLQGQAVLASILHKIYVGMAKLERSN